MTDKTSLNLKKVVKNPVELPSFPDIYFRVVEAINNPENSLMDIARVVKADASIAARILKLANSSFFGYSQKILSISHALGIIGTDQLRSLVISTVLISRFKGIPEDLVSMKSFWSHSIACGLAAKELCKNKKLGEALFVAGMLHDIGHLIIYKEFPEQAGAALVRCNTWGHNLTLVEQELLGFDHAEVGAALMKEWKLPKPLIEITAYHHDPLKSPNYMKHTAIIHVANSIAVGSLLGTSGAAQYPPVDEEIFSVLKLSPDVLPSIQERTIAAFEEISEIFFLSPA